MHNRLLLYAASAMISVLSCTKKEISLDQQVNGIIDSLSKNNGNPNKLFIVQHQKKWNRNYIKISTTEFFSKDSAKYIVTRHDKLIVYYSNFFMKDNKVIDWNRYDHLIYKEGTISIFHPTSIIFKINENGSIIDKISDKEKSQLFTYGNYMVPEPVPNR